MNSFLYSLFETTKAFLYPPSLVPKNAPYVRDPIDIKRVMTLVVFALLPATFFSILSQGMHSILFSQVNISLMEQYIAASSSPSLYFCFLFNHFLPFFLEGCKLFIPQIILIYTVGGIVEIFFASLHRKTVSEGFFVTGILFALILPSTLPYWMTITGVVAGLVLGKELFGGTGMNIFNPALVCRCILYFSFPSYMTGNIWVGANPFEVQKNVISYNKLMGKKYDTITTASPLNIVELPNSISRLQIDAVALSFTKNIGLKKEVEAKLKAFNKKLSLEKLSPSDHILFLTNGLGILEENLEKSFHFAKLMYNIPPYTDSNFYFGNMVGSFGETPKFAIHIGMVILFFCGLISKRIIVPAYLSAYLTAGCFYLYAQMSPDHPAHFAINPYKQLILGGLTFGIIFMATDPVSSPTSRWAQRIYGALIGFLIIIIRMINPAYPEGVMLAILFGNAFAPLLDRITLKYRKRGIIGKVKELKKGPL
jgi:Na+-transporting NADH:ubiquinone oxidoreductase subunit B